MQIKKVTDEAFRKYGRVLDDLDCGELIKAMAHTPLPKDEVIYVPSEESLELTSTAAALRNRIYGGMPVQIGYCNGSNVKLNAVEYHRDSEVNVAVTDLILLLGMEQDIASDYTYETAAIEAFLIPAGTAIEVYATTLHYAPCNAEDTGFRCVVVLPAGTNTDLDIVPEKKGEAALLFARNKWLIAHEEAQIEGAHVGLKGTNITL